jgi:hypothetical protein
MYSRLSHLTSKFLQYVTDIPMKATYIACINGFLEINTNKTFLKTVCSLSCKNKTQGIKNRNTTLNTTDISNCCVYQMFQKKMCSEITSSNHRGATVKFLIIWQGGSRNTSCFTEQCFEHTLSCNVRLALDDEHLNFITTKNFTEQCFEHTLSCNVRLVLNDDHLNFNTTKNSFYFTAQYSLKHFI